MNNNNKKRKIIITSLLISIFALIGVTSSYAFWKISKKQTTANDIVASCLNLSFTAVDGSSGINLLDEMPISDETAESYDGYQFKIKNECDKTVEFYIAAEKLTSASNSVKDTSISMSIKNSSDPITLKSDFNSLTDTTPTINTSNEAKIIKYDTLVANSEETYTYKMWVNETSDITDSDKEFETKLFVTAGQGVVDEERTTYAEGCYTINGIGTIIGYNVDATDLDGNACVWTDEEIASSSYTNVKYVADLTIPATVSGIKVTSIDGGLSYNMIEADDEYIAFEYGNETEPACFKFYDKDWNEATLDDNFYDWYAKKMGYSTTDEFWERIIYNWELNTVDEAKEEMEYNIIRGCEDSNEYVYKIYTSTATKYFENTSKNRINTRLSINSLDLSNASYLKKIGAYSFYYSNGNTGEIIIPDSVVSIGESAFHKYNGSKLEIGKNVSNIGKSAFRNYEGNSQILTIPNSVEEISSFAFGNFEGINLILGNNLKTIGWGAFESYNGSEELTIPNSVKEIKAWAFENYVGANTTLTIPNSVISIRGYAFNNFGGSNLILGNKVNEIGGYAFKSYTGNINVNRTQSAWNNAISNGTLILENDWKNASATLTYLSE